MYHLVMMLLMRTASTLMCNCADGKLTRELYHMVMMLLLMTVSTLMCNCADGNLMYHLVMMLLKTASTLAVVDGCKHLDV